MRLQQEYGLNESLGALHQFGTVMLVAVIVGPGNCCLMINGELPQEEHKYALTKECALPFVSNVLRALGFTQERLQGPARTYSDESPGPSSKRTYVIVRIYVNRPWAVEGGEWVSSAERALELAQGTEVSLRCIQKFLGDELAWKSPVAQLS